MAITASAVITQTTSKAAPEYVHLDCSGTTATGITYPFHHLRYYTTWGDPAAGTWSLTGQSKNISRSPIAGHVYESAGTYTIRTLIQEFNLSTGALVDQVIVQNYVTVVDTDTEWPLATDTVLYSTGTGETDWDSAPYDVVPTGSKKLFVDFDDIETDLDAGKRVLLKRTQTFNGTTDIDVTASNGYLGTWSSGGDDSSLAKPKLNNGVTGNLNSFDFRFVDLNFDGSSMVGTPSSASTGQPTEFVFVRCESHNVALTMINIGHTNNAANPPTMFCFYDLLTRDVNGGVGSGKNHAFTWWEKSAVLGCDMQDSIDAEHIWRTMMTQKVIFAHSRFAEAAADKGVIILRAQPDGRETQYVVWEDCIFELSTAQAIGFSTSTNKTSQVHDVRDIIVQNSLFKGPTSAPAPSAHQHMQIYGHRYTVRNCKFIGHTTGSANLWAISIDDRGQDGLGNRGDHLWLYNNSVYNGLTSRVRGVTSANGNLFDDVWIRNWVVHGPSTNANSQIWSIGGTPGGTFSTGNNGGQSHMGNTTFTFTDPDWVNNSPTQTSDMIPLDSVGPLIGAGAYNSGFGIWDDNEERFRSSVDCGASDLPRHVSFPSTRYVH